MNSTRCRDLIALKSKYQEKDALTQKKQQLVEMMNTKHTKLREVQIEINLKKKEMETVNTKFFLPLDAKIIILLEEKASYGKKLAASPIVKMKNDM